MFMYGDEATDTQVFTHARTQTLTHANCKQGMGVTERFCPWMLLHASPCWSPSPCCHPAAAPSPHYPVSCDSISESVGPKERRKKKKRKKLLTTAAKLRRQKQSPCPSTDYIRNSRDVNHALISSVLQRRLLCQKIAAACEAAFVRQRRTHARPFI